MPCEILITWKRYAGIVARMKQHHKCMGCTAWDYTAWDYTAWGCTAWGCIAWGCIAWGCIAWGCSVWDCIAWGCIEWGCIAWLHCMAAWGCIAWIALIVYRLQVCFHLFGGGKGQTHRNVPV